MIKNILKYLSLSVLIITILSISWCSKKEKYISFNERFPLWQEVRDSTEFENMRLIRNQILDQISSGINFQTPNNPTSSQTINNFGGTITTNDDLLLYNTIIQDNKSGTIHIVDIDLFISSIKGGGYVKIVWQVWYDDDIDTSNKIIIKIDSITNSISWSSYLKKQIFFINAAEAFVWKWWISLDDLQGNKTSILYPEKIREQLKPYITLDLNSYKVILDTDLIKQDMSGSVLSKLDDFDGEYSVNWMVMSPGIRINSIDINGKNYHWDITPESLWLEHNNEENWESINYGYKRFFQWMGLPWYSKHVTLGTTKWDIKTDFKLDLFQKFDIENANLNLIETNLQYKLYNWEKLDTTIIWNGVWKINPPQGQLSRPTQVRSIWDVLESVEIKSWD